ncbi:uncharacterized protein LOC143026046 [Oratosquilla oratoria]|uniref:uncharacterized protein LOC143026046 n=1 Tax=Oratosquilla oratoria TaxID=337810 RepID=UPI003F758704
MVLKINGVQCVFSSGLKVAWVSPCARTLARERTSKVLVNNCFPNNLVEKAIKDEVDRWYFGPQTDALNKTPMKLIYKSHMTSAYKTEERVMKNIISRNMCYFSISSESEVQTELQFRLCAASCPLSLILRLNPSAQLRAGPRASERSVAIVAQYRVPLSSLVGYAFRMRFFRRFCLRSKNLHRCLLAVSITLFIAAQIITHDSEKPLTISESPLQESVVRRDNPLPVEGVSHLSKEEEPPSRQGRQVQYVFENLAGGIDSHRPTSTSQKLDEITGPRTDWVQVAAEPNGIFVYSAYLDSRSTKKFVRVLAIFHKKSTDKVKGCILYDGLTSHRVGASARLIHENWNLPYSAAYIHCSVPKDLMPSYVAPVVDGGEIIKVVVQNPKAQKHQGDLAVCVKPFHYNFNRAIWLVEFVEFYRLLGVDHFVFYNHTVGPDVDVLLRYYMGMGLVSVMPWALPVKSQKDIRTEGLFAALNDCNFRVLGRYSLAAMVDVDEFLIPRNHKTLLELTEHMGPTNVYIFQNVFYYLYWENDTAVDEALWSRGNDSLGVKYFGRREETPYLQTLFKTRRLVKPHKPGTRSKYIVRPEGVLEVGNHMVWGHIGPKRVKNVPQPLGLSHHYRICEFGGYDCMKLPSEVDRITHQWLEPLVRSVSITCQNAYPETSRCPPAPPLGSPW